MTVIYQTTITHIGACATMALEEQMLITFREGAPADIEEYCFIHNHGELAGTLQPGAELQLGEQRYPVTPSARSLNKTCASWATSPCALTAIVKRSSQVPSMWRARCRTPSRPAAY